MASRSAGGVVINDRSRSPPSAMFSVRGIGVAVSVSTCTSARSVLSFSLSRTPKRCSSSTMMSPRSLKRTLACSSRCVAITISTVPRSMPSSTAFDSLPVRKRDSVSMRTGQSAKRSRKLLVCCSASSVVGTSTATCLPACAAMNAARIATSVLPKPTSPHTTRSMGFSVARSCSTWRMASAWSAVSSNGKLLANAWYSSSRCGSAGPRFAWRCAYRSSNSAATSRILSAARLRALAH